MLRRGRKLFTVLVILFALYVVLGFLLVPAILRSKGLPRLQARLAPTLTVERITFNPLALSLSAHGIQLARADSQALVTIEKLHLDLSAATWIRFRPVISKISLIEPKLHVARDSDGTLNWADVMMPAEASPEEPEASDAPPRFTLYAAMIVDGILTVEDHTPGKVFTQQLGPINFHLEDLDTESQQPGVYEVTATTPEGGTLRWEGDLNIYPLRGRGSLRLEGLALHRVSPYLATHFGVSSSSASMSLKFDYRFDLGGAESDFRIDNGSLTLANLKLQKAGEDGNIFALGRLSIADVSTRLPDRQTSIGRVEIVAPVVNAARDADGTLNLRDLLPAPPPKEATTLAATPSADSPSAAPWQWSVEGISLTDGLVHWQDGAVAPGTRLALHLNKVSVGRASSDLSQAIALKIDAQLESTGSILLEGRLAPAPLTADASLILSQFDPGLVGAYWSPAAGVDWKDGTVSVRATATLTTPESVPRLALNGKVQLEDFELTERTSGKTLVQGRRIRAENAHFDQAEGQLQIDQIHLQSVRANLERAADGTLNLPKSSEAASSETSGGPDGPNGSRLEVRIARIELADNQIDFLDASTTPATALRLEQLAGSIKDIDSAPAARAQVDLTGRLQGLSAVTLTGALNPFPDTLFADLKTQLASTDLTAFSPYSARFLGRKIAKGKLAFDLSERIENEHLQGANKVRLDQFEWGEKVPAPEAPKLPLDLAVTLFKDMNGVIQLDVPMEGDLNAPGFSFGGLILQVFGNLITKAATSPFRFLAGALLPEGVDPSSLSFMPGSSTLSEDASTLEALVAMHEARPLVNFELQGQYAPADSAQLQRDQLERTIEERWRARPAASRPPLAEARASIIRNLAQAPPEAPIDALETPLLAAIEIPDETLFQLARSRGEAAQAALIAAGLPADVLFLLEPKPTAAETPAVEVGIAR